METMNMAAATLPTARGGVSTIDVEAAATAVAYIVGAMPQATLHTVAKVMYFADKLHLGRHGRTIAGDKYIAMRFGPVPSAVYDSLKELAGREAHPDANEELTRRLRRLVRVDDYHVSLVGEPDLDWLSDSDVMALDEAITMCRGKDFFELTNLAHDGAWKETPENGAMTLESIAGTLPNAEQLLAYFKGEAEE